MAMDEMNNKQKPKKWLFKNLSKKQIMILLFFVLVFIGLGGMTAVKASDNPAFCSTLCHNMKPMYNTYINTDNTNLLAHSHGKEDVVCHDCHQDSLSKKAEEGVKYLTGDYEDPMQTRTFSKEMCLKCHDWEEVQSKTATLGKANENPHNSEHGGQPECSNCHKIHEQSTNGCTKCHGVSWNEKLDVSWKKN